MTEKEYTEEELINNKPMLDLFGKPEELENES